LVRGGALARRSPIAPCARHYQPLAAILGFAVLAAGFAPAVPIAFSAAASRDPAATGILVGRVATVGEEGSVAGPIAIGGRAQATSLRVALGLVVVPAPPTAAAADSTASSTAQVLPRQAKGGAR